MSQVILVTGTGRSGTSLAMQALHAGGVSVSSDLVPASASNVAGPFEDQDALSIQRELINDLRFTGAQLRPDDWQMSDAYRVAREHLTNVVRRNTGALECWAVKAPQISVLFPLWRDVCLDLGVSSKVVLCVRNAEDTVRSLAMSYANTTIGEAQQTYLVRSYYACKDIGTRAFVLGYETWAQAAKRNVRDLLDYCGVSAGDVEVPFQPKLDNNSGAEMPKMCLSIIAELSAAIGGQRVDQRRIDMQRAGPLLAEIGRDLARDRSSILQALRQQETQDMGGAWEAECRRRGHVIGGLQFRLSTEEIAHAARRADLEEKYRSQRAEFVKVKTTLREKEAAMADARETIPPKTTKELAQRKRKIIALKNEIESLKAKLAEKPNGKSNAPEKVNMVLRALRKLRSPTVASRVT